MQSKLVMMMHKRTSRFITSLIAAHVVAAEWAGASSSSVCAFVEGYRRLIECARKDEQPRARLYMALLVDLNHPQHMAEPLHRCASNCYRLYPGLL